MCCDCRLFITGRENMGPQRSFRGLVVLLLCCIVESGAHRHWAQGFMQTDASPSHEIVKRAAPVNSTTRTFQVIIEVTDLANLRAILENVALPQTLNGSVQITEIITTTVCSSSNMADYKCQCEPGYSWPIETCSSYNVCDTTVQNSCECITSIPTDGQSCQLSLPANTTTAAPITTQAATTQEYEVSLTLNLPVGSLSENILIQAREFLKKIPIPYMVSSTLTILTLNITTACYPVSNQLQCQCEEQYGWSCDKCNNYSTCGNVTVQYCNTIYGLPADGQYCEPLTGLGSCPTVSPCPANTTTTPEPTTTTTLEPTTTTTREPTTTTTQEPTTTTTREPTTTTTREPTTTTSTTRPPFTEIKYDISGTVRIPASSVQSGLIDEVRRRLTALTFPILLPTLKVLSVNLTTVCTPESGRLACQCEKQYSWPCDKCYNYSLCPDLTVNSTCDLIYGLPANDMYCQPYTSPCDLCPVTTTTTTLTSTTTTITKSTTTTTKSTTTTTKSTTATTTKSTTTTTTNPPVTLKEKELSVTMDVEYDNAYNNPENEFYKNTEELILAGCRTALSDCTVQSLSFSPGSTIVDSVISASSIPSDTTEIQSAIINEIQKTFPVIIDGLALTLQPVIFGRKGQLECFPPPSFNGNWTSEWYRDNTPLTLDSSHTVSNTAEKSVLTIEPFYRTDTGYYDCRIKNGNTIYRNKSGLFTFKEQPNIQLSQTSQTAACEAGLTETIECSVQSSVQNFYKLRWRGGSSALGKVSITIEVPSCPHTFTNTCETVDPSGFSKTLTLKFQTVDSTVTFACSNEVWGLGNEGDRVEGSCKEGTLGNISATCLSNNWEEEDNCVLAPIKELLDQTQVLQDSNQVPVILTELSIVMNEEQENVTESSATVNAVVSIMDRLANLSRNLTVRSMTDILNTSSILISNGAKQSWVILNNKTYNALTRSIQPEAASSRFLNSLETFTEKLNSPTAQIATGSILLNKTAFNGTFQEEYNSSVQIEIPQTELPNNTITVLTFESLDNVLPAVDKNNTPDLIINAKVALVQLKERFSASNNVSFTFELQNNSLFSPRCVFWNFSLFNNVGGWDDQGCTLVNVTSEGAICSCNHLTSFSILMSPYATFPEHLQRVLDFITYAGVALSIGSLIVCLIIEAVVWRKVRKPRVSYMRHVTIVNIALCLLIADIWFMIGAGISVTKQRPPCTAAAFFIHLFYLALFFWMLVSGLLLFYRTISVFDSGMRKGTMLAIGFSIGYGAPIIIAVVTIAATAGHNHYIQLKNVCWLNWEQSKALLAFVIPALTIVVINFLILCVVIYKIIRRRTSATGVQAEEKHVMVVIIRCLAFLTPFFGLTWCLGVATMIDIKDDNTRFGVHASFAFFNSIQGFFILLFGTLLDNKVRKELTLSKSQSSNITGSTSGATSSSSSGLAFLRNRMGRRREPYHVSSNGDRSFSNT